MWRFHQFKVARSTVHRILIRHGLGLLPANHKRKLAGHAWNCRCIRVLKIYDPCNQTSAIRFVNEVISGFANGRTTIITTDRTEPATGKPLTSGSWQKTGTSVSPAS